MAINMTPMIDIVFQLLIFFLTVSQVSRVSKEKLELPRLPGSQDQTTATVTVNVNPLQELIVLGVRQSVPEVVATVGGLIWEHDNDPRRVVVVLRVDRRAASQTVNQIVSALHGLGVVRVQFGVEAPE